MEKLIDVTDLKTRFHIPEGTVYAVNGISFYLNNGETLAVVGESGCGKSVSMYSIMGLIPIPPGEIASGSVVFLRKDLFKLSDTEMEDIRGKEIAMIFQDPMTSLNPVLTIGRQITESLRVHLGMSQEEANQRAADLLDQVGIPGATQRLGDYPHQFSGGMRQRVMIAMAIACDPKLLIADEPTTALDVTIQAQILDLMRRISQEHHASVILVTHDLAVAAEFCDTIAVMYAGRIVEQGPAEALVTNPQHPYTRGLLACRPRISEQGQKVQPIPGNVPELTNLPSGCAFAPRCQYAQPACSEGPIPLMQPAEGVFNRCLIPVDFVRDPEWSWNQVGRI